MVVVVVVVVVMMMVVVVVVAESLGGCVIKKEKYIKINGTEKKKVKNIRKKNSIKRRQR